MPSVPADARAAAAVGAQHLRGRDRELLVASAAPCPANVHRRLPARDDACRPCERLGPGQHGARMRDGRRSRFAQHSVLDDERMISTAQRFGRRSTHRFSAAADQAERGAKHPAIARFRRFADLAMLAGTQVPHDCRRVRGQPAESCEHRERVGKRGRVRNGRTGRNHARIVADDIGNRERPANAGGGRKTAPFDGRQVFADGIQRVDVRPGTKQALRRLAFVVERQPLGRNGHHRRRAARQEHKQLISIDRRLCRCSRPKRRAPRCFAPAIGCRMGALERLERRHRRRRRGHDDSAADGAGKRTKRGPRHRLRCLTGGNDLEWPRIVAAGNEGQESARGQDVCVSRSNARPDDGQDIGS